MLGIWALGERALGQLIGRTTATLPVSQGSFSLAGQGVTFKGALVNAGGAAYALNGQTVTFKFGEVVGQGAYTFTGETAAFLGGLAATQGAFALTGFAITEAFYFNAAGGARRGRPGARRARTRRRGERRAPTRWRSPTMGRRRAGSRPCAMSRGPPARRRAT